MTMHNTLPLEYIEDAFKSIGYKPSSIKKDYQFADLFSPGVSLRTVERAIFGQEPFDYRSACFGVRIAERNRPSVELARELKALGAPQVFILNNGITERWIITESEPILQEKYKTSNVSNVITRNIKEWNPKTILRAKCDFAKQTPRQLDFADAGLLSILESEASKKIDYLLREILHQAEQQYNARKLNIDTAIVFRAVFSLLAAKLIKDRDVSVTSGSIDFRLPETAFQAVRNHYGPSSSFDTSKIPTAILKTISKEIGDGFSLRNISVDTLTFIYENTFVSADSRKKLGIHSTPSYVADYVMSQIPLETLQKSEWHITDPMAGHGIFLIAAMRKIRDILPRDWSGRKRHEFYVNHLRGIEIDPFSIEVARLCLMLADFPEPNGWNLKNVDVFAGKTLEDTIAETMVLVGNPPFENIEGSVPEIPKPVLLLQRALSSLPTRALIGLVLPRSFIDGSDYKKQREVILRNFEIISLTDLPDRIFLHSDMETTILVARKTKPQHAHTLVYREVKDSEREIFHTRHQVTRQDQVQQSYFDNETQGRFIVPLLREIWEYLKHCTKYGDIADIRKGVEYESDMVAGKLNEVIRTQSFSGASPAIVKITEGFKQYIAKDTYYISTDKNLRRKRAAGAWDLNWEKPKIIIPAARMSRGPWRYAAAIDTKGRMVSRDFFAVWPKTKALSVEILAALLNSPVAVAFTYAHSFQRTITKRVYQDIPIPDISPASNNSICFLVRNYLVALSQDIGEAKNILLQIDAEILKIYNLPSRLERKLLDLFNGHKRPVPFEFTGYIPPEIDSWIPLHIYISEQFKEATPQKVMECVPVINDSEFIKYLKSLGREK